MRKSILILLSGMLLIAALSGCGGKGTDTPDNRAPVEQSAAQPTAATEQTIKGVLNRKDSNLVLLAEDETYYVMALGEGVTLDGLEEGDSLEVTYTGTLEEGSQDLTATKIEKIEAALAPDPEE